MAPFVELHILQNFAPANLNRDDTGSPKDCEFGGYRRARISSQCLKRAMRSTFKAEGLVAPEQLAVRTKRLRDALVQGLTGAGRDETEAAQVAEMALGGLGLELGEDQGKPTGLTQYLVFLGQAEIQGLVDVCQRSWDDLRASANTAKRTTSGRVTKAEAKKVIPAKLPASLAGALDGGRAADLALFGRMLADVPELNTDAAAQVAHALSSNAVSVEFDFYTAVDDLKPSDTAGADMIGTVEFSSACFYRYANVDLPQLTHNLGGDDDLARAALAAFIRASIQAIPTGKQNSMAAHNPPELVLGVVRTRGLCSLANAFLTPVRPNAQKSLTQLSVQALDSYWGELAEMYGLEGVAATRLATLARHQEHLKRLTEVKPEPLSTFVTGLVADAFGA